MISAIATSIEGLKQNRERFETAATQTIRTANNAAPVSSVAEGDALSNTNNALLTGDVASAYVDMATAAFAFKVSARITASLLETQGEVLDALTRR